MRLILALIGIFAAGILIGQESQPPKPAEWKLQAEHWRAQLSLCEARNQANQAFEALEKSCAPGQIQLQQGILMCVMPVPKPEAKESKK